MTNEQTIHISSYLISRIVDEDLTISPDDPGFRISLIMRMFSSRLSLVSLANVEGEIFEQHVDIVDLKYENQKIVPLPPKEAIKLLKFGIDKKKDIRKAITMTKKNYFGSSMVMGIIEDILNNISMGMLSIVPFLKLIHNFPPYIMDKLYSFTRYDDIIIEIIELSYKEKE